MGRHLDLERTRVPKWLGKIPASVFDAAYDYAVLILGFAVLCALAVTWQVQPAAAVVMLAAAGAFTGRSALHRLRKKISSDPRLPEPKRAG